MRHVVRRFRRRAPGLNFRLFMCVSNGYTNPMKAKDAGLRIRIERQLRDEFLEACRVRDRPAAQVIREFMREYVAAHRSPEATGSGEASTMKGPPRL